MQKQLFTNWKGDNVSFVANNITALVASKENVEETMVFVVGSGDPFYCSESYDLISQKLEICLRA